jgi:hypothetical protein
MTLVVLPLSDVDRFMLASKAVYSSRCPKCPAPAGSYCRSTGGGNFAFAATHKARKARVADWSDGQLVEFAALVEAQPCPLGSLWPDLPDGYYAKSEAAAASVPAKPAKQPTPKGVRLSETMAEEIERAAVSGGEISAPTTHFHGDAAYRQTINALAARGILREVGLSDFGYARDYLMTPFGWKVYREHRLVIRRLTDDQIDAGVASALAREQTNDKEN